MFSLAPFPVFCIIWKRDLDCPLGLVPRGDPPPGATCSVLPAGAGAKSGSRHTVKVQCSLEGP